MANKVISGGKDSPIFRFKYNTETYDATSRAVVFPIHSFSYLKITIYNVTIENAILMDMNNVK